MRYLPRARTAVAVLATLVLTLSGATVPGSPAAAATAPALRHPVGGVRVPSVRQEARARALDTLPASVDLRGYAPAVGDQGQIGSCVDWSLAYAIMGYWTNRDSAATGAPFAPLYLYLRTVSPGGAPDDGTYPGDALDMARDEGVDTLADFTPQGNYGYAMAPTGQQIANAADYRITGYSTLWVGAGQSTAAKTAVQAALAAGKPVTFSMPVYDNFMDKTGTSTYTVASGSDLGGHMLTAFGYDSTGIFVRNSWGTGWGDHGDVKIAWSWVLDEVDSAYSVDGISTPSGIPSAPGITALTPARVTPDTDSTVRVTGTDLADVVSATIDGQPVTVSPVSHSALDLTGVNLSLGSYDVVVSNAVGDSNTATLTVAPPRPTVRTLSKTTVARRGSTAVLVKGSYLSDASRVTVGGRAVSFAPISAGVLRVVLGSRAVGSYLVQVTTPGGKSPVTSASRVRYR